MKYVFSNYLIPEYNEYHDLIIFDTLHQHTVRILNKDIPKFDDLRIQILKNGEYDGSIDNLNILLQHKIIQSSDHDFEEELKNHYKNILKSNKILSLILLPTEQCNFRCIYCYEKYNLGKMSDLVMEKVVNLIEHLLPEYSELNLSWFGGEPLLAMDVIRTISSRVEQVCKNYQKPFYSQITTNGYLLDIDVMKELLKMHTMLFQITVDGDRETHNRQRCLVGGGKTYDRIINNLLAIKNTIKTKTIRIIVRINVSPEMTINEIHSLAKMFEDDDRFVINIQRIFETDNKNGVSLSQSDYLKTCVACKDYNKEELDANKTICYAAKSNTLMVRSNGVLGKCTVNFEDPNNNFGNIIDLDIQNFSLEAIDYCNSCMDLKRCRYCCIYPLCFARQCPAHQKQNCKEAIDKFRIIVRTMSSQADTLSII